MTYCVLCCAQDVSEWTRKKPWFSDVKAHMDDYTVRAPSSLRASPATCSR
eukprot:COSAG02_NODE_33893_length_492_cov_1.837150_1_plen_49_part_10